MNEKKPDILTRKQIAEEFQVSTTTIREWERRGIVMGIRINSRLIRYRREDINKILQTAQSAVPA